MKNGLVIALLCAAECVLAQPGTITTIAGGYPLGDGGPADKAAFVMLGTIAVDDAGNLFVVDGAHFRIRRITPGGTVTTVFGTGDPSFRGDGGPAIQAAGYIQLSSGVALDSQGNLFFSDTGNNRIRKVTADGIVYTVAGNGSRGFAGDGGAAILASFNSPGSLVVDDEGNLYVADTANNRVRRIGASGVVTTIAGTGSAGYSGDEGPASQARISSPLGLALDRGRNLYIADAVNARVRKVDNTGVITTVAGGGTKAPADGLAATEVQLPQILALAVDAAGSLYVNTPTRVYQVSPSGALAIAAGSGRLGQAGDGGPAIAANLQFSYGLTVDRKGNLYRSDGWRVRKVEPSGVISHYAGSSVLAGDRGDAVFARVDIADSVAVDSTGNVYVGSYFGDQASGAAGLVRKIDPTGKISLFAGSLDPPVSQAPPNGVPATSVQLQNASRLSVDREGAVYISANDPARVYKVSPEGMLSVVPGTDTEQFANEVRYIRGTAVDASGNLYALDLAGHRVVRVTRDGSLETVAGSGTAGYGGDGGPAREARLSSPRAITLDDAGNLYIADSNNYRIRKVTPQGIITTVAGTGRNSSSGDGGPAVQAAIALPTDIAVDWTGSLYILGFNVLRKVTPTGIITTVAGPGSFGALGDGGPAVRAYVGGARGVAVDWNGNVYIADTFNFRVRKVQGSAPFTAEPGGLMFTYALGAQPAPQTIALSTADREARKFETSVTVAGSRGWLSVSPASGSTDPSRTVALTVTANPVGLLKGTYTGRITITNPDTGEYVVVPVSMTVSGSPQQLKLSPTAFTFAAVAGGAAPPVQNLRVLNTGAGQMNWSVSTSTLAGGAGWLSATAPGVDIRVNPAGLKEGTYYGLVTVTAPGVDNSPQSAVVLLVVLPANQPPGPVVDPLGLIFTTETAQKVQVSNVSTRAVQFTSSVSFADSRNWFTYTPTLGTVQPGQGQAIEIRPTLANIPTGIYRGELSLKFTPDNTTVRVSLLLVVAPGTGKTAQRQADAACTPKQLLPLFRRPGDGFNSRAGWPESLQVEVVDDCKVRMNAGQVVVSFSNGDPAVSLTPVGEGLWTGVWASRNPKAAGVQLTARAEMAEPRLSGESKVTGGVRENPEQPLIAAGGVLNGASLRREAPVAVGSHVAILGSKLAKESLTAGEGGWPLELGETVALMAGRALPLQSASENQLSGLVPYGVADSTRQQLIVRRGLTYSPPEEVLVATSEPAVYTVDASGSGQGKVYVLTEDGPVLADASRPVKAGDRLVVYATGLGPVDTLVKDGEPGPADPPARVVQPVKVTIQGKEAEVVLAALSPSYVGVYEVQVVAPAGLKADTAAQVILSVGEQSVSPVVTIAVAGEMQE